MDGATIQARIYAGRGKAAKRIGLTCQQYRPQSAAAPLANPLAQILVAFNSGDNTYAKPNVSNDPVWYADFDGRLTQTGDYLVRALDGATWFISAQQQLLPIVCVECNRSVKVTRQQAVTAVGAVGYGGMLPATSEDVLGGDDNLWPASILIGGRKEQAANLPAGVKNSGWRILMPPSVPIVLKAGDLVTDDHGRRFMVDAAELTDQGWRMNANEAHT